MTILEQMVENYKTATIEDKKNAMKEVVQEIVLASLSKTDFFKNAAFYGGTALRIFYGLDRFSEDLDFTLLTPDVSFSLDRKSTRLNSSHVRISYAVFCLKK